MLTASPVAPRATSTRGRYLTVAGVLIIGAVLGFAGATQLSDSHTADAQGLTGTVNWSNQTDNMFSFQKDGDVPDPGADQVFYQLVSDAANYPKCLVGAGADPVREDVRRVTIQAVHVNTGGRQDINVAIEVTCLS